MRKLIIAAAAALFASASLAQPPPPPKLLVVISVDQFSADLFDEYRPQFTGGLARLASGTVFRNGYQSHAATETCPGHSTILTGDHPARTGIIANSWIDQSIAPRATRRVYCAEDETRPGTTLDRLQGLARASLRADARRADEGALARQPQRRRRRQGPRGGDDDRPQRRPALVLDRHQVRDRPHRHAVPPVVAKVNAAVAAGLAHRARPLEPPPSARQGAPIRSPRRQAGRHWAPRPRRRRSDRLSASPEFDGDTLALAAGAGRRDAARPRVPTPTCSRSACRRPIMSATPTAPRARRCACSSRARPRPRRLPRACSTAAASIMPWP